MTQVARKIIIILLLIMAALPLAGAAAETSRKVKSQVQPILPEMARHMNLKGTVRLEVEIGPEGTVKSTKALGGHPVLIQCAEEAIHKWRFEPGPATKTVIEFNFHRD